MIIFNFVLTRLLGTLSCRKFDGRAIFTIKFINFDMPML